MDPVALHVALGFLASFWHSEKNGLGPFFSYPLIVLFHTYQIGAFILRREKIVTAWRYDTAATWHRLWPKLVAFAGGFGAGLIVRSLED